MSLPIGCVIVTLPYGGNEQDVKAMLELYDNPEELMFPEGEQDCYISTDSNGDDKVPTNIGSDDKVPIKRIIADKVPISSYAKDQWVNCPKLFHNHHEGSIRCCLISVMSIKHHKLIDASDVSLLA